jgi:endonuclease/exonuclease/phosphatase family metal-dependent hydrolase
MKRKPVIALLLIVLLCCTFRAQVWASDAPVKVHVLSYNAENVFDDKVDGTEYAEYESSSNYYSDRMWQVKLDHIHNVLKAAGSPQIAGLVEVESARMAQMILDNVKDLGYTSMAVTTGHSNTQCMLLSTYPIHFIASLATTREVRDILVTSVNVGGDTLYVLVNHWKAKDSTNSSEELRIQDATVARTEVENLLSKNLAADVLLIGDFNSSENEHQLTDQTTGINDVLKITDNRTAVTTSSGTSTSLYDGWFDLPQAQRGSEVYHDEWEDLGHIIMSPGLFDRTGLSYDDKTFGTFRASFLLSSQLAEDGRQIANRWQVSGTHHSSGGYSDHLPVTAEFTVWPSSSTPVTPVTTTTTVTLKIGSKTLSVARGNKSSSVLLDAPPVIIADRSMVPIRAVIEAFGGSTGWNASSRTVSLALGSHTLRLTVGSGTAYLDGKAMAIDDNAEVIPVIQSGHTLLPLRLVGESFGMTVHWEASTRTITLSLSPS